MLWWVPGSRESLAREGQMRPLNIWVISSRTPLRPMILRRLRGTGLRGIESGMGAGSAPAARTKERMWSRWPCEMRKVLRGGKKAQDKREERVGDSLDIRIDPSGK